MDEDEAIRQCQAGDIAGLEVLYQNYHLDVFKFALANVRYYDLAEDITQQVFIELFTAIKKYKSQHRFLPWLLGITAHKSIDELRRRQRREATPEEIGEVPSSSISPEESAEASELRDIIRQAVWDRDLKPKQRMAIVLRNYFGLSEDEMRIALDCSRGTVKSRLSLARTKLHRILAKQAPDRLASWLPEPAQSQERDPAVQLSRAPRTSLEDQKP